LSRYLDDLEKEATKRRPRARNEALEVLSNVAMTLETFSRTGRLVPEREIKNLERDIEEFKIGSVRLLFYRQTAHQNLPAIRLTNGFTKVADGLHPRRHLRLAHRVQEEDIRP
jgi:hypothetical protein